MNFDGYNSFIEEEEFDDELYAAEIAAANAATLEDLQLMREMMQGIGHEDTKARLAEVDSQIAAITGKPAATLPKVAQRIGELVKQRPTPTPTAAAAKPAASVDAAQAADPRYAAMLNELKSVDIFAPENDLAFLFGEMRKKQSRQLDESLVAAGLHCLTLLAMKKDLVGIEGVKLNLITLLIAETAAGKEAGHGFINTFAGLAGLAPNVFGEVSSDKDMIKNLLYSRAKTTYLIDEAHGLFDAANDRNAATYKKAIPNEILKMATNDLYKVSGNHRREIADTFEKIAAAAEKRLEALSTSDANYSQNSAIRDAINADIVREEKKKTNALWAIDAVDNGIASPFANFYLTSTPVNLDKIVTLQTLESGLIGRLLLMKASDHIPRRTRNKMREKMNEAALLNFINSGMQQPKDISVNDDADCLLELFFDYCEEDERRMHQTTGALWRRAYERVICLSSILAARTSEISRYDVLYAIKLTVGHIETCAYLAGQNAADTKSASQGDVMSAAVDRVRKLITDAGSDGLHIGTISSKLCRNSAFKALALSVERAGQDLTQNILMRLSDEIGRVGKKVYKL